MVVFTLLAVVPASASASRGIHDYFPQGTAAGTAAGQFNGPQGVAINATTGDIYVVDGFSGNHRIQQFDSDGEFIRMWGKDVDSTGGTGSEICEVAAQCKAGAIGALGGEFNFPRGIAIDQVTGDVYVTEQNNRRVQKFSSTGVWQFTWGKDVDSTGGTGFEICSVAAQCKFGAAGALGGEFSGNLVGAVAVAPAAAPNAGNVLVADPTNRRVQEFTSAGAFVRTFGFDVVGAGGGADNTGTGFEICTQAVAGAVNCKVGIAGAGVGQFSASAGQPARIAIDSSGAIYTVESLGNFRVQKFTPQVGPPQLAPSVFSPATLSGTAATNASTDIAIGSGDRVLVVKAFPLGTGVPPADPAERRILELDSSGALQDTHMVGAKISVVSGLGADPSGTRLAITSTTGGHRVWVLDEAVAPTATISPVTGIGARTATFNGQVNPGNALTGWHFEYSDNGITWTSFPSEDAEAGNGTGPVSVLRTVPGRLKPNTAYQVRLVARHSFGLESATSGIATFTTPKAPPQIVEQIPAWVEQTKATLRARIEPSGEATTYHFEWGPDPSDYAHRIPVDHELFAGDGTDPVTVDAEISGLSSETKLYFRVVAINSSGTAVGGDQPFETPNDLGLIAGRRYELVSPPDKGLVGQAGEPVLGPNSHSVFASPGGNKVSFPVAYATPEANGGDEPVFLAQRGPDGWTSEEWSPPVTDQPKFEGEYTNPNTPYFLSRNLDCGFLASLHQRTNDPVALPVFEAGGTNLYRQTGMDEFTLVSNLTPTNPSATYQLPYQGYSVVGASESCDRMIFTTPYRYPGVDLTSSGGGQFLYQWKSGVLSDPAVIPGVGGPEFATAAIPGASGAGMSETAAAHNVVSEDGSRFFFTATSLVGGDAGQEAVFVREDDATAVDVSQSQTGTPNNGPSRFEMATPSGDFVFFKARYGLAANGTSTGAVSCDATALGVNLGAGCDLYRYEVDTGELLDISASTNPEDTGGAAVAGVLDVSDDGSRVYFAAKGQLVAGKGQTYAENMGSLSPGYNIYLWDDVALSYVATVTQQDATGGDGLLARGLIASHREALGDLWSSDATPDGGHLVFLSRSNLTDYPAGVATQAYIYSAGDGVLRCISCRRDGQQSIGSPASFPLSHAAINDKASRYSSYMSADGSRIFFHSQDSLAPGAVTGETNFYEWHQGQLALLATDPQSSALHRVSVVTTSGGNNNTVFLTTHRSYVPWDTDGRRDVYALRVGGGFAGPPTPPAPCNPLVDACQGESTAPPAAPAPGSAIFSGPGNSSSETRGTTKHRKQKKNRKCKKQKKCKKQGTSKRGRK